MSEKKEDRFPRSEIFIGIVAAVGADTHLLVQCLKDELKRVDYKPVDIRLSKLLGNIPQFENLSNIKNDEYKRIDDHMAAGDKFRMDMRRGEAVAMLGLVSVVEQRVQERGKLEGEPKDKPLDSTAFIFNSLKHPSEIKFLREVYKEKFFVVSAYSPKKNRVERLSNIIAESRKSILKDDMKSQANYLVDKDEKEADNPLGQNVQDSFPEGDYFVDMTQSGLVQNQVRRFIDLLFGNQFITPTVDEYGMFHAKAASLRSADLSRQVGAVIATTEGELIAAGCNEVPKPGGGSVWEGNRDHERRDYRDFRQGFDPSTRMKQEIIREIMEIIKASGWLNEEISKKSVEDLVDISINSQDNPFLKNARVSELIEFGRIVHAEMSAITEAARRGLPARDGILYCTTFPCHMCARHIISAGIKKVVYIEPYPKSKAKDLYQRSICVDGDDADEDAVEFTPFFGVSPRKYISFFEKGRRKDSSGARLRWDPAESRPIRISNDITYLEFEKAQLAAITKELLLSDVPGSFSMQTENKPEGEST